MTRATYCALAREFEISPDSMMEQIDKACRQMMGYLYNALAAADDILYKAHWRRLDNKEVTRILEQQGVQWQGEDLGKCVQVRAVDSSDASLRSLEKFMDAPYVYDVEQVTRDHRIRVNWRLPEANLLFLERWPKSEKRYLYVKQNTVGLERQRNAICRLQDNPYPSQLGLLKLLMDLRSVDWNPVREARVSKYYRLTEENQATKEQRKFVRVSLGTPDFAILEGPPGSGKTTTIVELIEQLAMRGKRVLLVASTHVAVDNVIERLAPEILVLRVGIRERVSERTREHHIDNWKRTVARMIVRQLGNLDGLSESQKQIRNMALRMLDEHEEPEDEETGTEGVSELFQLLLEGCDVVAGTTIGVMSEYRILEALQRGRVEPPFDVMILDEASKTPLTEFFVPAIYAKKWIVVGDIRQLSPYVEMIDLETNIRAAVPSETTRNAALYAFSSSHIGDRRNRPTVVVSNNTNELVECAYQAIHKNLTVVVLGEDTYASIEDRLNVEGGETDTDRHRQELGQLLLATKENAYVTWASDMILSTPESLKDWSHIVPHDMVIAGEATTDAVLLYRMRWGHSRNQAYKRWEEPTWEKEVAWRLVRIHELRRSSNREPIKRYQNELQELMPVVPGPDPDNLLWTLKKTAMIALPSIVEILLRGYNPASRHRNRTVLTHGLPKWALSERHVALSYQRRMHPEISRFPRERFYQGQMLKDFPGIDKSRAWSYTDRIGDARCQWVDVRVKTACLDRNEREARAVAILVDEFVSWATRHEPENGEYWEVAVLSFYRKQEELLKKHIARQFKQVPSQVYWRETYSRQRRVRIEVCTVDRFQGHEADIVILSFARNRGVGFLDCPNRLNVALTRARYQLMIVGDRKHYSRQSSSEDLKMLAQETPLARRY